MAKVCDKEYAKDPEYWKERLELEEGENATLRAEITALKDNAVDLRRSLFDTAAAYHAEVAPAGYPVSFFHCHHEVCMKAHALLSPQAAEPIVLDSLDAAEAAVSNVIRWLDSHKLIYEIGRASCRERV